MAANTSLLSRKTAQSREGNVDVEPPSSMDDSSMIFIEIGVGVDEGLHPNMTIVGRAQSSVKPRRPVELVTKKPTSQLICRRAIDPLPNTQRNSQ